MVMKSWEQEAGWLHCLGNQEADRQQEVGTGYKTFFDDLFPLARLHLLNVPQPSQIVSEAGEPSVLTREPRGGVTHWLQVMGRFYQPGGLTRCVLLPPRVTK